MRKRIMAMLLALVMVVGVLPVAALAEEPVSTTEPTTVPTETTAPTEATALAEAVQTDVSQYALTDGISTYDAFNCYVALIPDSTNAKPTGFKVKVGDTVNGYKVLSLNSRTYEVHIDIGVLQSESALPKFRIPLPEEIWTGVKATDSTWVLCVNHWKPGDTMKLDRGGNQMRYYSMGTEWYFALKFDANGGSGAPAAQTYTTDTASETSYTFTIPKTVPARKGYTFQGWSFEKNGTASYQPGETCTLTRPKDGAIASTLYAVWEEAVPSKPEWSDIRREMQKVSVHVTCINPDVNHTDKTYPYQESTDDVIGYVQDSAGSYTCTVTVHLGRYRTNYNSDFNREHQFASSLTADVVLQYNGTGWVIASALPLELKLTCGSAPTPAPPGQDVLGRLLVQVECDAITYHFTKTYQLDDGDYRLERVDDNTYTVTVTADKYVEKYNIDYGVHTLFDNNTKTIKLVYRYGAWTVVGSNGVTFNVSCEQKYTVTYTDGVDGEVIFKDQVYYKKPGEKTPAFRGTPTRTGYKFIGWEPAVAATVTGNATYTAVWEEEKYTVIYTDGVENEEIFADQVYGNLLSGTATPAFNGTPTRPGYVFTGWNPAVAATVTGNATYAAVWEEDANGNGTPDKDEEKYTVTYTDGVENEEIFADQVYGNLLSGTATPAFNGTPTRTGYVFGGWNPAVAAKVTGSQTYTATWKVDANGNGIPDDEEDKYTVTYTDGVENEEIFADQVYGNLLPDTATPAFNGTPTRTGYVFGGWNPAVAAKVTGSQTYTATWKVDANGNGIADDEEDKFTVTYTDGMDGKIFVNQVYENLLPGTATPAFNGTPTRTGYVFGGWNPAVAAKVTESKTYTATWKADANGNGIADDEEDKYTVTYTDGVKGKAFADQVYDNLLSGTDTPAFNGKPTRKGYTFVSWTPKVTDTVTKTVTYTATWKANSGKDNVPKTGDSGIVPVLGSVLLFSFCGAAACVFDRKRKHI